MTVSGGVGVTRVCVRVHPAEVADVPGLVSLTRSLDTGSAAVSGRGVPDYDLEHLSSRFAELVEDTTRHLLVAVDDPSGQIVGLLVARKDEIGAIDLTPVLYVSHLIVVPGHRRRGIGRALLAAAVHLADEMGVERVLAAVASSSREGNRYLARLGFAPFVVHRVATTNALRRSLGLTDEVGRMAVLRRARLIRAQRSGLSARTAGRGA